MVEARLIFASKSEKTPPGLNLNGEWNIQHNNKTQGQVSPERWDGLRCLSPFQ